MRLNGRWLAASLGGAVLVHAAAVGAQGGDSAYRVLVENGIREFDAGNYQEALASFEQAAQIRRGGRVMRGIAKVRFELRQYTATLAACAEALGAALDPLNPTQRAEVVALQGRAVAYTGTVTLRIQPADSQVLFDGRPLTPAQRAAPFRADVGAHSVEIAASGYAAQRRTIDVPGGGDAQVIVVALVPAGAGSNPLLYVSAAAGLASAGAVIGAVVWIIDRGGAVDTCQRALDRGGNCVNGQTLASEHDLALWTLVGSGAVLAASAITFGIVVGTAGRRDARPAPGVACAPTAGGLQCAAGVAW